MTKEVVIYDKVLKIENEKLHKDIDELKAENMFLCTWTKAIEKSVDQRMQDILASEAALRVEQNRFSERILALEVELTAKTSEKVQMMESCSQLEAEV